MENTNTQESHEGVITPEAQIDEREQLRLSLAKTLPQNFIDQIMEDYDKMKLEAKSSQDESGHFFSSLKWAQFAEKSQDESKSPRVYSLRQKHATLNNDTNDEESITLNNIFDKKFEVIEEYPKHESKQTVAANVPMSNSLNTRQNEKSNVFERVWKAILNTDEKNYSRSNVVHDPTTLYGSSGNYIIVSAVSSVPIALGAWENAFTCLHYGNEPYSFVKMIYPTKPNHVNAYKEMSAIFTSMALGKYNMDAPIIENLDRKKAKTLANDIKNYLQGKIVYPGDRSVIFNVKEVKLKIVTTKQIASITSNNYNKITKQQENANKLPFKRRILKKISDWVSQTDKKLVTKEVENKNTNLATNNSKRYQAIEFDHIDLND